MRENSTTTITGPRALLVPYSAKHVPLYHSWMECEKLRQATASEKLSLEEELENQRSWAEDEAKLTFIVCDATRPGNPPVGDVNLFFKERSPPSRDGDDDVRDPPSYLHETAEVEVMIAEPSARGKGIAREAVATCLWWAATSEALKLRLASAKISRKNGASLSLFREKLGFSVVGGSDFFEEDHLELELFGSDGQLVPVLAASGERAVVGEVASREDAAC